MVLATGIIFAIVTAIVFGLWTVFHNQAANYINALFGAILVSLTAVAIGTVFLLPKIKVTTFYTSPKGIIFAILAGVCAFAIDYFALKTYSSGIAVSVGGPIIIGGSVAIASIIGFFLGEAITLARILGLVLVITGSALLTAFPK